MVLKILLTGVCFEYSQDSGVGLQMSLKGHSQVFGKTRNDKQRVLSVNVHRLLGVVAPD